MSDISFKMGFIFFTQTGVGIMGSSLLLYYSFPLITGQKVRPTDLIRNQLVFANNLVLFRRIPQIVSAFVWKDFLSDTECHTHAFWVTSGPPSFVPHSFGLSSPEKDAHGVLAYGLYFWILQLVANIYIFIWITGQRFRQNMNMNTDYA